MVKKHLVIIVLLIILDQLTKIFFKGKSFFIFNYTTNTGAAFSLFQNQVLFLIITSIAILIFLIYMYKQYPKLRLYLSLIIAGTIGNLIDRIFLGHVRDFIDFKIWPIFNVADSLNVVGVILIIYHLLKED